MWQEFFSQAYKLPLLVLKRAMANPMGIFIYGILSKWYIMVMIAVISVTFWVFKGLEQAGVIDAITKELKYGFREAQAVAQKCTPLIVNLPAMWDCIQHTSGNDYVPNEDEKALINTLQRDFDNGKANPFPDEQSNPYDAPASPYNDSESHIPAATSNIPTPVAPEDTSPYTDPPEDNGDGVNRL